MTNKIKSVLLLGLLTGVFIAVGFWAGDKKA